MAAIEVCSSNVVREDTVACGEDDRAVLRVQRDEDSSALQDTS